MKRCHIEVIIAARKANGISRKAKKWSTRERRYDIRYLLEVGYLWESGDALHATRKGIEAMFDDTPEISSRFL